MRPMSAPRWIVSSALLIAACSENAATPFTPETDSGAVTDAGFDARTPTDVPAIDARDAVAAETAVFVDSGAHTPVCGRCTGASDCGADGVCVEVATGSRACLPRCNPDVPVCPGRLRCVLDVALANVAVCAPVGGVCCIDADSDEYGQGVGCRGPDCDDNDRTRMGPPEACLRDGGADVGTDVGTDAGTDAGVDAGTDAGVDAGVDSGGADTGGGGSCDPAAVRWNIPVGTRGGPECITTGGGYCEGTGYCSGGTCRTTPPSGCGESHCGTLRCNDGTYIRPMYCTVIATCDGTSGIIATGYTW